MIRIIVILTILFGCASKPRMEELYNNKLNLHLKSLSGEQVNQLASLGSVFINSPGVKIIKLSKRSTDYLERAYDKLILNNELILKRKEKPKFFIVKNKIPFYFSLPYSQFFFSTGLLEKFLDNEDLFNSVLSYEVIKSQHNIYRSIKTIPVGYIGIERLLSLVRIDLKSRVELKKWAYFILKRSGNDPFAILNWIQLQNKNILDFSLQNLAPREISREEFLFKNFIVSQGLSINEEQQDPEVSKGFYRFLNEVKSK